MLSSYRLIFRVFLVCSHIISRHVYRSSTSPKSAEKHRLTISKQRNFDHPTTSLRLDLFKAVKESLRAFIYHQHFSGDVKRGKKQQILPGDNTFEPKAKRPAFADLSKVRWSLSIGLLSIIGSDLRWLRNRVEATSAMGGDLVILLICSHSEVLGQVPELV